MKFECATAQQSVHVERERERDLTTKLASVSTGLQLG